MAEAPKFNLRNPAVKRIMQEIKEIKQDTSGDFLAEALETDIFEWHFVIRGPPDTEFDGGIYHGRILLPAEYPFKPPSFMMLTPNGRFETNMKICLSISSHHPEHWQPSWSVRTALTALIAFMPSPGAGALGALDFPKEERRALAARSRMEPPRFGSADRQRVIEEMHGRMMAIAAAKEAERRGSGADAAAGARSSADGATGPATGEAAASTAAGEQQQRSGEQRPGSGASEGGARASAAGPQGAAAPAAASAGEVERAPADEGAAARSSDTGAASAVGALSQPGCPESAGKSSSSGGCSGNEARPAVTATAADGPQPHDTRPVPPPAQPPADAGSRAAPAAATATAVAAAPQQRMATAAAAYPAALNANVNAAAAVSSTDHMLTALMWALYVGIGAILLRKVMGIMGFDLSELMQ